MCVTICLLVMHGCKRCLNYLLIAIVFQSYMLILDVFLPTIVAKIKCFSVWTSACNVHYLFRSCCKVQLISNYLYIVGIIYLLNIVSYTYSLHLLDLVKQIW